MIFRPHITRSARTKEPKIMLLTLLIVLLAISLFGGGFGQSRYGYASWSPLGIVIVVIAVLFFLGHVRL